MTYYRGKHLTRTFLQCCDGQMTPGTFKTDYTSIITIDNSILVMGHCKYLPSDTMLVTIVLLVPGLWKHRLRSLAGDYPGVCLLVAVITGHQVTSGARGPGVPWCHCSLRCSLTLLRRHSSAQIRVSSYNLELACPSLAIQSLITLQLIFLSLHRV